MAGLSLDRFSVVTKSLHPTFQAQFIEKAVLLQHVSGEFGLILCKLISIYPIHDFHQFLSVS